MHVVILNASFRERGNSELLSKLIFKKIQNNGYESGEIINLRDYKLQQCNGCMRCIFKNERCPLPDDFYSLMEKIVKADAFFLIAPTYVTTIPGSLKLFMDKYLLMPSYFEKLYSKPAVSIGVASPIDWFSFQLPLMNMFLLGLGFKIIDSFLILGAGPGEVLLEKDSLSRLDYAIKKLCSSSFQSKEYTEQILNHCPVCFSSLFERIDQERIRCPVCHSQAEWRKEGFIFSKQSVKNHRWTKENIEDHFRNWILRTKELFRKNLPEIIRQKKKFGL
ncbi:flavodoxin family protein [Candidatus Aminicenantes bacterium AH-873-B07]|jgi:hypothetical protein|nr:flavodoxin family protein [Candidatus Aminicenantes bacterium AH-873-B07]